MQTSKTQHQPADNARQSGEERSAAPTSHPGLRHEQQDAIADKSPRSSAFARLAAMAADAPASIAQRKLASMVDGSPLQTALRQIQAKFRAPTMRKNAHGPVSGSMSVSQNTVTQLRTLEIGKTFNSAAANRDDDQLGLGEVLTLTSAATGADHVNEGVGAAQYALESGTGTLAGDTYTADGTAGNVEFSVKRADEGNALKHRMTMEVVAPDSAGFVGTAANHSAFGDDEAGAGFDGDQTRYMPTTVSFVGLEFREGAAPFTATGAYQHKNGEMHPEGDAMEVDESNVEDSVDTINSEAIDETKFANGGPGQASWPIPWQYSQKGEDDWTDFMIATHLEDLKQHGEVTMSKLNGSATRTPPAGTW